MISVVLTSYNGSKFIKQQLDSIINQTVSVDEVIIIDDKSNDNTADIISSYIKEKKLTNWKLYVHEINQGYISSFKDGLKLVSGDIIILSDQDDIWKNNKVQLINDTFNKNTDILYLATSFDQIDDNGKEILIKQKSGHSNNNLIRRSVNKNMLNKMTFKDIAVYNISPGCTCALKKELKDLYLNTNDINVLPHDWSLAFIASVKNGLYYLDQVTTKYRIHSSNTIGLGHKIKYTDRLNTVSKNYEEKNDELNLLKRLNPDDNNLKYLENLNIIYKKRVLYLKSKNIFKLFLLIFKTFEYKKLYESVIYDTLSVFNN